MEQIFKSLLQKQGYEHIGVIDAEKKIWGYTKEGVFYFCKEDLTEVKRNDLGCDFYGTLVFSLVDDNMKIVKNEETVSSYIVIDNSDKVIAEGDGLFHLLRINSDSLVMVLENSIDKYRLPDHETSLICRNVSFSFETHFFSQIVVICGKIEKDYILCMYHNSYYFFNIREYDEEFGKTVFRTTKVINGDASHILYEGSVPYAWLHKDNSLDIVSVHDEKYVELITHSCTRKYNIPEIMGDEDLQIYDCNNNYNDDCLLFPFIGKEGVFVLHRRLTKMIMDYRYYNYNCYSFYYEQKGETKLFEDLIEVSNTYPISYDSDTTDYYLYNIYGEYITTYNSSDSEHYLVFSRYGEETLNEKNLYGVLEVYRGGPYRIVIPPIYKKIENVGGGYFEVSSVSPFNSSEYLTGVYDVRNGLVVPIGTDFCYPQYTIGCCNDVKLVGLPFCVIYSSGKYKGLIIGGKVITAQYDSVDGFSYHGDYFRDNVRYSSDWEQIGDVEYYPQSVVLCKRGFKGLAFVDYDNKEAINVIPPQYETLTCCMILKGHAYFEVSRGNKHGVISDSVKFNKISECIYDKVEVENRKKELVIKVFKDGKIGMISSNLKCSIPVKYSNLVILHNCYIGDGKYYSMKGVELLSEQEYVFVADGVYCQAYKNRKTAEYVFVCDNGDKLEFKRRENEKIIEVKSPYCDDVYEFDIDKDSFVKDEHGCQSYDDYDDYERDTWFAMTDGQYGDMPDDFDGDYDFTGN